MAVTKIPFKAKHGLASFEDSTFSKAVTITGNLTVNGAAGLTVKKVIQSGTDSMVIPKGTTAQRDVAPVVGSFRANTETNNFEGYIDGTWAILGGTTSLKTGAYQNIELITAAAGLGHEVIAGDSGVRVYRDVVGIGSGAASVTGALVFKLPAFSKNGNTMIRMRFVGLNFAGNQTAFELDVGGYWYSTTPGWNQLKCISKGATPVTQVRGAIAADGSPVIIIGADATVWAYPKVVLEMLEVTHAGVAQNWYTGWTAIVEASTAAYTSPATAVLEQVYTTSNFDPATKLNVAGGTITGALNVNGALTVGGLATFSSGAQSTSYIGNGNGLYNYVSSGPVTRGSYYVNSGATGGSFNSWNTTRPAALQVDAISDTSAYMIWRATNWGSRHLAAMEAYAGGSSATIPTVVIHVGGTSNAFTFDGSGNFSAVGNVTAFSDKRLKTDLVRIENALDKVETLTGYTFTRTDTGERQTGLIAQDVLKVLPEAINVMDNPQQTLGVAYGNLMGLIVEALKELRGDLKDLKERVSELEKL
uniref:Peptidase S74 domain-containing protein n=1 Tax=Pseudomonas phage Cygsa01 TaxID=3138529 RepID=A0AAU6W3V4_9VIRU